jgi:hypothetical protein
MHVSNVRVCSSPLYPDSLLSTLSFKIWDPVVTVLQTYVPFIGRVGCHVHEWQAARCHRISGTPSGFISRAVQFLQVGPQPGRLVFCNFATAQVCSFVIISFLVYWLWVWKEVLCLRSTCSQHLVSYKRERGRCFSLFPLDAIRAHTAQFLSTAIKILPVGDTLAFVLSAPT